MRRIFVHRPSWLWLMTILALVVCCGFESKPSYHDLEVENEELHAKLSGALEHVEEAEDKVNDLESEIEQAETEASAYNICEDAEAAAANAHEYAGEAQSSLEEAKNELE